jgi:hypothetical protein
MPKFTYTDRPREVLFAEGDYQFVVEKVIEREHDGSTPESTYDMFVLTLRLWLTAQKKWSSPLRDYLRFPPSPGAWRIGAFLKSIGWKVSDKESIEVEAEDLAGAQGWLTISHREYEDETHNNVAYIRRRLRETSSPQPAAANAPKAPPAQKLPTAEEIFSELEPPANWTPNSLPEGPTQPQYAEDDLPK